MSRRLSWLHLIRESDRKDGATSPTSTASNPSRPSSPQPLSPPGSPLLSSPPSPSASPLIPSARPRRIIFHHRSQPFFELTNFYASPITFDGKTYPTAEHLFQAHKFLGVRPDLAERMRSCEGSGMEALELAKGLDGFKRDDWFLVNVDMMFLTVLLKFTQHPSLASLLLSTGHATLVEGAPRDFFWGAGADGSGKNMLGKVLMRVRRVLRRGGRYG